MLLRKYDVVIANLDPTKGSEQKGIRPCLIFQNNIANEAKLNTTIVIPLTTSCKKTPSGILIVPSKKNKLQHKSRLELTQIRVIDKTRIIEKIGILDEQYYQELFQKTLNLFDLYDEF